MAESNEINNTIYDAVSNALENKNKQCTTLLPSTTGKSAYDLAVDYGYVGTESMWLKSLQGLTAYDVAVTNGYKGTKTEWLKYIKADGGIQAIQDFLTKPSDTQVNIPDYGKIPSLQGYITRMFENGGLPATPFKTKALMTASALADGKYAQVTDDTVNNGLYIKAAGVWTKSDYDPLKKANDYTDAVASTLASKTSPAFAGTPTAPTADFSDRSTQIANTTFAFTMQHGQLVKTVTSSTTLTEDETNLPILIFTGSLSSDTTVTVPTLSSARHWTIRNATSGNYKLILSGSGSSIELPRGISTVYCNATSMFINSNELKANTDSPKFTGLPTAPSQNLSYSDPFAIANVTTVETLTKKPRSVVVTSPLTTIPSDLSKAPVLFLIGTLTSNTDVFLTLPIAGGHWIIRNATSGNYKLTIKGSSGTGIQINKNELVQIVSNGSSVFKVASNDGAAVPVAPVKPLYQLNATLTAKVPKTIMTSISKDRTHGWGYTSNTLDETWDDGETWDTIHTFSGESIDAVKEMGDGELLIVTAGSGAFRKVWRTVGKDTTNMTMVECFAGHAAGVKFTSSWSIFTHENMVLVADYGPKAGSGWSGVEGIVPEGDNARYVRVSLNNGKTWKTIFDLNEFLPSKGYPIEGSHVHGIAYDKWWDRLWLSFGDNAYNTGGVLFSDDFGKTWNWANEGKVDKDNPALSPPNSTCQVVGIIPIEGSILFGTDTSPNGVLKIDRVQGKKLSKYRIEVGFAIDSEPMTTHLCQGIYRASDDHPVFFAFGSELTSSPSCIVATWDGVTFKKVWEDTVNQPAGFGLRSVIAPTIRGNLIAAHNDTRISGKWSELKGKAPIY